MFHLWDPSKRNAFLAVQTVDFDVAPERCALTNTVFTGRLNFEKLQKFAACQWQLAPESANFGTPNRSMSVAIGSRKC